ncbi:unnamed protein product [Effrenium voratum]|uniref:SET domain-containing protein n=1 Tax=Effrenium voratum TaxID=2562239 RepID=A0AA36NF82_9DINO|nr:unnamed protein product [Effrenium voratum]
MERPRSEAAGCDYINEHCQKWHNSVVHCQWTAEKGRILRSRRSFKTGDIIFREPPLHLVSEQPDNELFQRVEKICRERPRDFIFGALWYWAALCSLTAAHLPEDRRLPPVAEDVHKRLLLLCGMEITAGEGEEAREAAKVLVQEFQLEPRCQALDLERVLQVWIVNCFEHTDEPLGYATYFLSSFTSHSCFPNAVWHYDGDDFVLRAREDIEVDDEVTLSYLSEESLMSSSTARRQKLKASKHFVCRCERCVDINDPCRGFRCPRCSAISLQLGAAREDEVDVGEEEMASRQCENCHVELGLGQAAMLNAEEKLLSATCAEMEPEMGPEANSASLLRARTHCPRLNSVRQHFLLDQAWDMMSVLHQRLKHSEDAERLMRRRMEYQALAYPGNSAHKVWIQEAYADMLVRHARDKEPKETVTEPAAAKLRIASGVPMGGAALVHFCVGMSSVSKPASKAAHKGASVDTPGRRSRRDPKRSEASERKAASRSPAAGGFLMRTCLRTRKARSFSLPLTGEAAAFELTAVELAQEVLIMQELRKSDLPEECYKLNPFRHCWALAVETAFLFDERHSTKLDKARGLLQFADLKGLSEEEMLAALLCIFTVQWYLARGCSNIKCHEIEIFLRILDLLERNDEFNSLYDDEVRVSGWRYAVDEEVSYALARSSNP